MIIHIKYHNVDKMNKISPFRGGKKGRKISIGEQYFPYKIKNNYKMISYKIFSPFLDTPLSLIGTYSTLFFKIYFKTLKWGSLNLCLV